MKSLELKIHPPIVLFISIGLAFAFGHYLPFIALPSMLIGLYWYFCIAGVLVAMSGLWAFRKAKTTIDPAKPEKASQLVSGGVYRVTRNPMYVGLVLVLTGFILYFGSLMGVIALPLFIFYITTYQIKPEERIIEGIFGEEYVEYKKRVRRWI